MWPRLPVRLREWAAQERAERREWLRALAAHAGTGLASMRDEWDGRREARLHADLEPTRSALRRAGRRRVAARGGSVARDGVAWMKKYDKLPIAPVVAEHGLSVIGEHPSVTVVPRQR